MGSEIFFIFSWSSKMKLLTLIVALFLMAQASDEQQGFHIREEDSGNLRSLGLPSKVVRQAEETEVDKLGGEPRNLRSLGVPESQVKWGRQKKTAKKMNAESLKDLSSMNQALAKGWGRSDDSKKIQNGQHKSYPKGRCCLRQNGRFKFYSKFRQRDCGSYACDNERGSCGFSGSKYDIPMRSSYQMSLRGIPTKRNIVPWPPDLTPNGHHYQDIHTHNVLANICQPSGGAGAVASSLWRPLLKAMRVIAIRSIIFRIRVLVIGDVLLRGSNAIPIRTISTMRDAVPIVFIVHAAFEVEVTVPAMTVITWINGAGQRARVF